MDFRRLIGRYRQFGGIKLVWAYMWEGMLPTLFSQGVLFVLGRKPKDEAYAAIRWKVNRKLQRKYVAFIQERKDFYEKHGLQQQRSKRVWVCWLQGFEEAPLLVKVCVASMQRYLKGSEIILLTEDNCHAFTKLPQYVVEKYEKGLIPPALFSDLVRLEVLIRYGGTWMDATMLCTGEDYPKEIMDCDLFMYQSIVKGDNRFLGVSNWFITACTGNKLLMVLRDVLLEYWKNYSVTMDYFMFHDFFYTIAQLYPKEIAAMPRKNRLWPLQLMERMGDRYDGIWWEWLKIKTCFHKLSYRLNAEVKSNSENFYHTIIRDYSRDDLC